LLLHDKILPVAVDAGEKEDEDAAGTTTLAQGLSEVASTLAVVAEEAAAMGSALEFLPSGSERIEKRPEGV
jgi:hypothetical protein